MKVTRELTADEWVTHGPDICRFGSVIDWDAEVAKVTSELFKARKLGVVFNVPTQQFADELINRLPQRIWPRVRFAIGDRTPIGPVFVTLCPRNAARSP